MEEDNNKKPECSFNPKVSELWGVIWKLAIPNAGKNFMWRAYHNLLPTKRNLLSRKVVKEPMCPFCEMEEETVSHIIWECPSSRDVWGAKGSIFHKCNIFWSGIYSSSEQDSVEVWCGKFKAVCGTST